MPSPRPNSSHPRKAGRLSPPSTDPGRLALQPTSPPATLSACPLPPTAFAPGNSMHMPDIRPGHRKSNAHRTARELQAYPVREMAGAIVA
eukprot:2506595-Rhodomonas_salina.2